MMEVVGRATLIEGVCAGGRNGVNISPLSTTWRGNAVSPNLVLEVVDQESTCVGGDSLDVRTVILDPVGADTLEDLAWQAHYIMINVFCTDQEEMLCNSITIIIGMDGLNMYQKKTDRSTIRLS